MRLKTINEAINEADENGYKLMGMGSDTDQSRYDYNRGIVRFRGAQYLISYNEDGTLKGVIGLSQKSKRRDEKALMEILTKDGHTKADQPVKEPNDPAVEAQAQTIINYLEEAGVEIHKASVIGKKLKIITAGAINKTTGGKSENSTTDLSDFLDEKGIKYGFNYGNFGSATFTLTINPKVMTALGIKS